MSELSDAEQSCLAGNVAPQVRALLGGAPDLPEETAALIQCLEDETLLRLFLTGLIGQTGPLSAETSTCVRSGFANFDLRSVMLATPAKSNEAAAMAGSMAGFLLTLSCLSEEEWQAVGPTLGMGADDRDGLQCVLVLLLATDIRLIHLYRVPFPKQSSLLGLIPEAIGRAKGGGLDVPRDTQETCVLFRTP